MFARAGDIAALKNCYYEMIHVKKIEPNSYHLANMLYGFTNAGEYVQAVKYYVEISQVINPNFVCDLLYLKALIGSCCNVDANKTIDLSNEICDTYFNRIWETAKTYSPSDAKLHLYDTYKALLAYLAINGNLIAYRKVSQHASLLKIYSGSYFLDLEIFCLARARKGEEGLQLLNENFTYAPVKLSTYNALLRCFTEADLRVRNNHTGGIQVYYHMRKNSVDPDLETYLQMARLFINSPSKFRELNRKMTEIGLLPNAKILKLIFQFAVAHNHFSYALKYKNLFWSSNDEKHICDDLRIRYIYCAFFFEFNEIAWEEWQLIKDKQSMVLTLETLLENWKTGRKNFAYKRKLQIKKDWGRLLESVNEYEDTTTNSPVSTLNLIK